MGESRHERLRGMVENARHDSVTADRLDSDPVTPKTTNWMSKARSSTSSKKLETYLNDEQPHFIFITKSNEPNIYGPNAPTPPKSPKFKKIVHIVTDRRWLMIGGHDGAHQQLEIPIEEIEATNYDTESQLSSRIPERMTNSRVILKTEGAYYEIPVSSQYSQDDFIELCGYLREAVGARPRSVSLDPDEAGFTIGGKDRHDVDEATLSTLLDEIPESATAEANELLQSVDDADRLVQELSRLIEEHEVDNSAESLDDLVADAETVEELREDLKTPVEKQVEDVKASTDAGVEEIKTMLRGGDPQVAGQYGIQAGIAASRYTKFAGTGGYAATLLAVVGGGMVGLYQDTRDDTVLDQVDPEELMKHVDAMAGVGAELEDIDGEIAGALLGASAYLGQQMAPEEYAQWILEADPEAILHGADQGAAFFADQDSAVGNTGGAVLGGGLGLLASYATQSGEVDDDALQNVLDADLYAELSANSDE